MAKHIIEGFSPSNCAISKIKWWKKHGFKHKSNILLLQFTYKQIK